MFACGRAGRAAGGGGEKGAGCGRYAVVVAVFVVIVILLLFIVTQTNITLLQPHRDMANTPTDTHSCWPGGVGSKRE